ncbi:hypothetical protein [Pseudomonas sp. NPDC099000]|uniref:hypothetical protein n=1 Tax=Pseudomonas sp. NPDC099000 TaxID=3364488 RepID=UPI00383A2538
MHCELRSTYKFSERKYLESFFNMGNVRIGTLFDFRSSEHKQGIADPTEGTKIIRRNFHFPDGPSEEDIAAMVSMRIADPESAKHITMINSPARRRGFSEDCFIYCTSAYSSKSIMSEFGSADSCYELYNGNAFYDRITSALNEIVPVRFVAIEAVHYRTRTEEWSASGDGRHPSFIQEEEFSGQFEVRAIWAPREKIEIAPVVINDIGLTKFCREVKPR